LYDEIDLKELERVALRSYHADGLIDIFMGGYLMFIGLNFFIESEYSFPLLWAIHIMGTLLYNIVKKRVTYPRLGFVRLTKETRRRIALECMIVIIIAGFVTLKGLFYHMGVPENAPRFVLLVNKYNLLFQGGVLALIFLMLGKIMNLSRLSYYSILSLTVFSSAYLYLGSPFTFSLQNAGVPLTIIGIIVMGVRVMCLQRFIERYPKRLN